MAGAGIQAAARHQNELALGLALIQDTFRTDWDNHNNSRHIPPLYVFPLMYDIKCIWVKGGKFSFTETKLDNSV
jgi:hypothetical protein